MIKPKVLFLCSDNGCRTRMAEAFLRDMAGERFEVVRAGAGAHLSDFPGAIWRLMWPLENPAAISGRVERRAVTRRVRDQIRQHVVEFVREHA